MANTETTNLNLNTITDLHGYARAHYWDRVEYYNIATGEVTVVPYGSMDYILPAIAAVVNTAMFAVVVAVGVTFWKHLVH